MAITQSTGTFSSAPKGINNNLYNLADPTKYTSLYDFIDEVNAPDVRAKLSKSFGNQGISGFLKMTGAIKSNGTADNVQYFEEARLHQTQTATIASAVDKDGGAQASDLTDIAGGLIFDTVLTADGGSFNDTSSAQVVCRVGDILLINGVDRLLVTAATGTGFTTKPLLGANADDGAAAPTVALGDEATYSQMHYDYVCQTYGDPADVLSKYDTIFVDSITVAARLCFVYCQNQPECRSDRTGKLDTRAAYGMQGREMMGWLSHLQHIRDKNVVFVGILDQRIDDYGRETFELQLEGAKTSRELPGIVDEVITMAVMSDDNGNPYRAFVCQTLNQWGYPAKDRSGRLELLEEPHLGKLLEKMSNGVPQNERTMNFVKPTNEVENVENA